MSLSLHTRKSIYCLLMGLFFCTVTAQNKRSPFQKERDTLIIQIVKDSTGNTSKLETLLFDNIKADSTLLSTKLNVAISLYRSRQYARSTAYFEECITLSRKQKNNKTLKRGYFYLGNVSLLLWQNEKALEAYYSALEIDFKNEKSDIDVIIQINIAMILRRMRQPEQALVVLNKALEVIPETKYYRIYATQGLKMSQDIEYAIGLIDLQTKLGALAIEETHYKKAEEYLSKALSLLDASEMKNEVFRKNIHYFRALKDYKTNNFEAAIDGLESIVNSYNKEKPQNELIYIESTRLLAESYREVKNQDKSIYYYKKHTSLNDEYQLKKATVVGSIFDKETSLLDEQIASLETRTFLNIRYKWLLLLSLCLTLIGFTIYLFKYKKRQSKSSNDLKVLTEKIEHLKAHTEKREVLKNKREPKEINLDDDTTRHILKGIAKLETQEFFLKTDCSLRSMARKIKTNATYLSHIIISFFFYKIYCKRGGL